MCTLAICNCCLKCIFYSVSEYVVNLATMVATITSYTMVVGCCLASYTMGVRYVCKYATHS